VSGIVVGVDGSEGSFDALRWASREAELRHRDLTAVMAWGWLDQRHLESEPAFDPVYDDRAALRTLDAFVERTLGPDQFEIVERRVVNELAAPALLKASVDADLLVVGARGLGGFRSLLVGSVSQHCLHHARSPIAIVRPAEDEEQEVEGRIVVGIDGSENARDALRWALDEARRRRAALEVVHAWQMPALWAYPYAPVGIESLPFEEKARELVDQALRHEDTASIPHIDRVLVCGGGASAVLHLAKGADLVVVGTRGLGGFKGLLLGSVSTQIAHHAPCPVVAVPPADRTA
jgi:nucleotide-binding universal stress UspA family protein